MKYFLAAIVLAILVGGGYYFYAKDIGAPVRLEGVDQTTGWKTYNGLGSELTFKYPPDWKIQENRRASNSDLAENPNARGDIVSVLVTPPDVVLNSFLEEDLVDGIVILGGGQHGDCGAIRAEYPDRKCEIVGNYRDGISREALEGLSGNNSVYTRSTRPDVLNVYNLLIKSLSGKHMPI